MREFSDSPTLPYLLASDPCIVGSAREVMSKEILVPVLVHDSVGGLLDRIQFILLLTLPEL